MRGIYDTDLAYIHHAGFGALATGAAPGLLGLLADAGIAGGTVIDLGCGSGITLKALTEAGYEGIGVDISPQFIDLARRQAPKAKLHVASAYSFSLPRCRAVTAIGEVLGYLPDDSTEAPAMDKLARRVHGALEPGGLFVFDVMVTDPANPQAYRTWRTGDDWAVLVEVQEDQAERHLTRDIIAFRAVGGVYRRSEERHSVHLFEPVELESQLTDAGFAVETALAYGEQSLAQRRLAFICRKQPA